MPPRLTVIDTTAMDTTTAAATTRTTIDTLVNKWTTTGQVSQITDSLIKWLVGLGYKQV